MKGPGAASKSRHEGSPRHVIVGTAGHIDHGKTALVRALTGTDTDRLPEEKQRGITIDLGFASLELTANAGRQIHLSLIDVPGHHAFVRNMLAGAGGIDCVLLVVAADEGVKEQTREHLEICSLLGVQRGLVVLTKVDAVSADHLEATRTQVREFLSRTFLEDAPLIAVSALRGTGLEELKQALAKLGEDVPERSREAELRLPLDRSFSMRGFGTVVTGTLQSGSIHSGDVLEQHPGGRSLRVRGLQVHGKSQPEAQAPCRVALNLPGVEVAQIGRGDMLIAPGALAPVSTVDVRLNLLADALLLRHGTQVRVHAFTSDCLARVLLFDQHTTSEPGSGFARLRLREPMLLLPGDRVVLRQASPARTIGGATVLDTAMRARVRKAESLAWLRRLTSADGPGQLSLRVERQGIQGIKLEKLRSETGWTVQALRERLAPLVQKAVLSEFQDGTGYIDSSWLQRSVQAAEKLLNGTSLSRSELRARLGLNPQVFALVVDTLAASGKIEVAGESLRKKGTAQGLPEAKRRQMEAIEALYTKGGLAAPLYSDVARQVGLAPAQMRELVTMLLRARRLVRMGSDETLVHVSALEQLYAAMRKHRGESFDVARFKSFTGLTRKHAIPLLEHLDETRITRNQGGTRIVL